MGRFALSASALLAVGAGPARADTAIVDGIEWTYTVSNGEAMIGDSISPAISTNTIGDITIPSAFGVYFVKSIGNNAFSDCSKLTSVTIPDGVTDIGRYAFSNCRKLASVTIPDSVTRFWGTTFNDCAKLFDTQTIPGVLLVDGWVVGFENSLHGNLDLSGVRGVANYAFERCSGLASVSIPENLTNIPTGAFSHCSGLTTITIPDNVTSIGAYAFASCTGLSAITIPDSVTSIGMYAFDSCTGLSLIMIPDSVTSIGAYAFASCTGLTKITIPDGVSEIENGTFSGCPVLKSIVIPGSVRKIGDYAFSGCTTLETVDIQFGVIEIGAYAFYNCYGLLSVSIPSSVEVIGDRAFMFSNGYCPLDRIVVPEGVKSVGERAFWSNPASENRPTSVSLPGSLENLGFRAFGYQEPKSSIYPPFESPKNSNVVLVDGWVSQTRKSPNTSSNTDPTRSVDLTGARGIASQAFRYARRLTNDGITFQGDTQSTTPWMPDSVKGIGTEAFLGCTNLVDTNFVSGWCIGSVFNGQDPTESFFRGIASWAFANRTLGPGEPPRTQRIDGNCRNIGFRAFSGDKTLGRVTFDRLYHGSPPDIHFELKKIGCQAFVGCTNLQGMSVTASGSQPGDPSWDVFWGQSRLPASVLSIEYQSFRDCVQLNFDSLSGLLNIGPEAFKNCTRLTAAAPDALRIGAKAFSNCSGLALDALSANLLGLGYQAFEGTASLQTNALTGIVSVGDWAVGCAAPPSGALDLAGFRGVADRAFAGCTGLTAVTIPIETRFVGHDAFARCEELFDTETIPGVILVDGWVVGHTNDLPADLDLKRPGIRGIASGAFAGCKELASVALPTNACNIGDYAFANCTGLRSVVFPAHTGTIGNGAFIGCTGLASIWFQMNSDVSVVGNEAFAGCTGLTTVAIPPSVQTLGTEVFRGCRNLSTLYLPGYYGTDLAVSLAVPETCEIAYGYSIAEISVHSARGRAHPVGDHLLCAYGQTVTCSVEVPEDEWIDGEVYRFDGCCDPAISLEWPPETNVTFRAGQDAFGLTWGWGVRQTIRIQGDAEEKEEIIWPWMDDELCVDFVPSESYFQCFLSGDTNGIAIDYEGHRVIVPTDEPRSVTVFVKGLTLASALDAPNLSWATGGAAEWFPQFAVTFDGEDAAQSGTTSGNGTSWMETEVKGPGTFRWTWKIEADGNAGVDVLLDGTRLPDYEPTGAWTEETLVLDRGGTHTIRFAFRNAGSTGPGDARAFVDRVVWEPVPPSVFFVR